MGRGKKYQPEQVVNLLRQIEVAVANGKTTAQPNPLTSLQLPPNVFVWCYGPEFVAKDLRKWLARTGAKTLYIEPGSPWESGYCESFNSKLRDEFLNGEIFYSIKELRVLAERWRVHYNTIRPHSSLGYRSPAPPAWLTNSTGHRCESPQRVLRQLLCIGSNQVMADVRSSKLSGLTPASSGCIFHLPHPRRLSCATAPSAHVRDVLAQPEKCSVLSNGTYIGHARFGWNSRQGCDGAGWLALAL